MRNLENVPDIAWIRIELHNDMKIVESNGNHMHWIPSFPAHHLFQMVIIVLVLCVTDF